MQVLDDPICENSLIVRLLKEARFTLLRQPNDSKGAAVYISTDGIYKIHSIGEGYQRTLSIYRKFPQIAEGNEFVRIIGAEPYSTLSSQWPALLKGRTFWVATQSDTAGRRYGFFTDEESEKLLDERICLDASGTLYVERWRDANGSLYDPPLRLLDPQTTSSAPFFHSIAPDKELFFWGAPQRDNSEAFTLQKVELPLRGVSFTAQPDSKGICRLFCDQQPSSYITEEPLPTSLAIQGAIPLKTVTGSGSLRLLLPTGKRSTHHQLDKALSSPENFQECFANKKYYIYDIDTKTMRLKPPTSKALLQLVYSLKNQGSFAGPFFYIF